VISPLATIAPVWIGAALLWWRAPSFTSAALTSDSAKHVVPQLLASVEGRREPSNEVRRALLASGLFSKTDPATFSRWCEQLKPVRFAPGRLIAADGDFGGRLYVILSGRVEASYRRFGGREIALTVLGSHEIIGRVSLFDPAACETQVTALTEVLAVPIELGQLLEWMAECSGFSARMLRLFARRNKEMTDALTDFAFADAPGRVASRLLFLRRRFGQRDGEVVRIAHDLTVKELSRLVGVSPKLIDDTLRDFEDRGWIRLHGTSVVIVDSQALASVRSKSM
jgi:CRP/FNR family transcriptional regulator, cyclic AMP receptor protein